MHKILLVCAAGMSTSLLVTKIETAAKDQGVEIEIEARPVAEAPSFIPSVDVVLLGPQVRFQLKNMQAAAAGKVPVDVIEMRAYGTMRGDLVLKQALDLIEANKK